MFVNTLDLALLSTAVLGFRHGFDYDHVAAITDITSVELSRSRGMRLGLLYVLGHGSMVAVLGAVVVLFQRSLPPRNRRLGRACRRGYLSGFGFVCVGHAAAGQGFLHSSISGRHFNGRRALAA
jgi:hypothetical protein